MDCSLIQRDNIAERYLAGRLAREEQDDYELHFFECDRCFSELCQMRTLREALQEAAPARPGRLRPWQAARGRWHWPAAVAVAASAVVVSVLVLQHDSPQLSQAGGTHTDTTSATGLVPTTPAVPGTITRGAQPPPEVHVRPDNGQSRASLLARIAKVEPPRYAPSILRGAHDEASRRFSEGMQHYVAGEYRAAVPLLKKAASLDPTRADAAFFLAAAELLAGDPSAARDGFERVLELGDTPFAEEARYYLAKAQLGQADVASAKVTLARIVADGGEFAIEATRLLSSLDELPAE